MLDTVFHLYTQMPVYPVLVSMVLHAQIMKMAHITVTNVLSVTEGMAGNVMMSMR